MEESKRKVDVQDITSTIGVLLIFTGPLFFAYHGYQWLRYGSWGEWATLLDTLNWAGLDIQSAVEKIRWVGVQKIADWVLRVPVVGIFMILGWWIMIWGDSVANNRRYD